MLGMVDKLICLKQCTRKGKIIKLGISFLVIVVFLAFLPAFKYEKHSGGDFAATNFSNIITSKDIVTVQFSPLSSSLRTIRLRVVTSPDFTNDTTQMIVRILENDTMLLEQAFAYNEIIDGKHCAIDASTLKLNGKYTLEIKSNHEASGFLLLTGNNGAKENRQWFWADNQETSEVELVYISDAINMKKFAISFVFLLIALTFFLVPFEIKSAKLKLCYDLLVLTVASCLMFYSVELLGYNSLSNIASTFIVATVLFIYFINLSIYLFTFYCFIPIAITGPVLLIIGVVNHFVISYRNAVFVPSDIFAAATATNIISSYKFDISLEIVMAVAILTFLLSISFNKRTTAKALKKTIIRASCGAVLLVATIFTFTSTSFHKKIGVSYHFFDTRVGAEQNGFLLNFAALATKLAYATPEGYSASAMPSSAPIQVESASASFTPNVIIIMNESLADFNDFGALPINKDYLPFIHSLANKDNSFVGRVVVPVFGGGTSNSEFEALTGFSLACAPTTQSPYSQFIRGKTPSLPYTLSANNYSTSSLHLCDKANWNRNTAYPNLGFDYSLFIEDFDVSELLCYREVASDEASYDIVLNEFEKARNNNVPFFNFSITMQNHGGYRGLFDYKEITINQDGYSNAAQYLNLAYLSDQAFEGFIGELEHINEPTIVVMFGDHYPYFPQDFFGLVTNGKPEDKSQISAQFKTPIVFWANFDIDTQLIPELFSINYLQSILLDLTNMPKTPYQQFLSNSLQELPVFSTKGFIDKNNNYFTTLAGTGYEQLYADYSYWQYAGLFDNKKLESLFY